MKTVFKKTIEMFFCVILLFGLGASAQNQVHPRNTFLRVYNLEGKKLNKGQLVFMNDSILALNKNGTRVEISFAHIGKIKTKRSGGHNIVMGAAVGASLGVIVGISTAEPDKLWGYSAGDGALGFGTLGAIGGAAAGGVVAGVKGVETYIVNGDFEKWKIFKEQFN